MNALPPAPSASVALHTTLPGDIPDLLRRGSPVRVQTIAMVVSELPVNGHGGWLADGGFRCAWPLTVAVALDLTDPTGRVHAAWWCRRGYDQPWSDEEFVAVARAHAGDPVSPEQIDTLARLVLRLAGRTP